MLETLRAKPNHVKQIISFVVTIVLFSVILFIWWSSRDARSRELEVREKTVSPVSGVSAMFGGFMSGLKEKISNVPATPNLLGDTATSSAPSTDTFDLSGVVVIDPSASSGKSVLATSTKMR